MNTLNDRLTAAIAALPTTELGALNAVQLMRRFDTKYVVPETWLPQLMESMSGHAHVLSVEGDVECRYDNLYFELPGDRFLQDHLRGKARRMKVRKRRYASNNMAFLEVKERLPGGRTEKERIATGHGLSSSLSADEQAFLTSRVRHSEDLMPSLSGGFYRTTLVDFDRNERVTVDRTLNAAAMGGEDAPLLQGLAVIEVKQPRPDRYSPIQLWLRSLNDRKGIIGRETSMSKYTVARLARDGNIAGRAYLATYRRLINAQSWAGDLQA
jgi:hypothetical protein